MPTPTDDSFDELFTMEVPIAGLKQPIPVLFIEPDKRPPRGMGLQAPDTRNVEVFTTWKRGENFYGSLDEDFFVCRDGDDDFGWTVLWVTFNADQAQDNVQRLLPFCALVAGWLPDDLEAEMSALIKAFEALELEGLVLLWAYANRIVRVYHDDRVVKVQDGLITGEVAKLVLEAGKGGKPLVLSEILIRRNGWR